MELKFCNFTAVYVAFELLIVPYGSKQSKNGY